MEFAWTGVCGYGLGRVGLGSPLSTAQAAWQVFLRVSSNRPTPPLMVFLQEQPSRSLLPAPGISPLQGHSLFSVNGWKETWNQL